MSEIIVPNVGEEAFLDLMLSENLTLRLFTNDVTAGLTPDQIDNLVAGDFTEATFTGYSSKALTGGSWTTTQGTPSTGTYATQTFARTSTGTAQNVRGYYVTRTTGGALRWFEQFPAPISMATNGDAIVMTPTFRFDDSEGNMIPVGMISPYGSTTAPTGWLRCDGAAVSRTTYAALFAVIGSTYGNGDGSTTFNLPNLQQRFPLGKATSGTGATMGGTGGTIDHVHGLNTASSYAAITIGAGTTTEPRIRRKSGVGFTRTHVGNATGAGSGAAETSATELGGNSDTGNPPFQVVDYIIRAA